MAIKDLAPLVKTSIQRRVLKDKNAPRRPRTMIDVLRRAAPFVALGTIPAFLLLKNHLGGNPRPWLEGLGSLMWVAGATGAAWVAEHGIRGRLAKARDARRREGDADAWAFDHPWARQAKSRFPWRRFLYALLPGAGFLTVGLLSPVPSWAFIIGVASGGIRLLESAALVVDGLRQGRATLHLDALPIAREGALRATWEAPRPVDSIWVKVRCVREIPAIDVEPDDVERGEKGALKKSGVRRSVLFESEALLEGHELPGYKPRVAFELPLPPVSKSWSPPGTRLSAYHPVYWELVVEDDPTSTTVFRRLFRRRWVHLVPIYDTAQSVLDARVDKARGEGQSSKSHAVGQCPRCEGKMLDDAGRCESCRGELIRESDVEYFAETRLHLEPHMLRELLELYANKRIPCPACGSRMTAVPVKGVEVDLCGQCGSLWVDGGQLAVIEQRAHGESDVDDEV